ncbi:hypothetical protein AHAS_Ahas15G0290200 [Arachis hypogaea]
MAPRKLPLVLFHEWIPNQGREDLKQHLSQLIRKEERDKSNPRIKRGHLCGISIWSRTLPPRELDAGRDGAGSQPILSRGLPCPKIERKCGRRKGTSPASSRKLCLVGAAYSLGQCSKHESVTPPSLEPMLSNRLRLGKRGRATCRKTCTCGSGRVPRSTVLICVGPRNLSEIVMVQKQIWSDIPLFPVLVMFFISRLAETNCYEKT